MEALDEHESPHSPIQLLVLHSLEYVCSEVRMVESPILDLSSQDDHDKAERDARVSKLRKADALGNDYVEGEQSFIVRASLNLVTSALLRRDVVALGSVRGI